MESRQKFSALKLSIVDQSPLRTGGTYAQAVQETIELAKLADQLGYTRFWVAEHHGSKGFAGAAPEILIARLGAETRRIRVGSGGVMLSHYSPLKVAEQFKLLETMYPGRIDLGIGRAPGSDQITAAALAYGSEIGLDYFPTKIYDTLSFLSDRPPATDVFARVKATPSVEHVPEVWLLGSSDQSAAFAARFGLAFSFAHFINETGAQSILQQYRQHFRASEYYDRPTASIGISAICADTEEEALRLASSGELWRVRFEKGEQGPWPSPEEAAAYPYTDAERAIAEKRRQRSIIGTPEQVKAGLQAAALEHNVDELVVLTITYDFAARKRSYELLAEAFSLTESTAAE